MKAIFQYMVIATFFFTAAGCEDLLEANDTLPDQEYFFLYEYINYAWGYQHNGWLIDSSGKVRYFRVPEKWMVPSTDAALEIEGIENYAAQSDSVITEVERSVLAAKAKLINAAARGKLTDPESVMADAGAWSYYALRYDSAGDSYERILLRQEGDWEVENRSDAAEELYKWMKDIGEGTTGH